MTVHPCIVMSRLQRADPTTSARELETLMVIYRTVPTDLPREDLIARVRRDLQCDAARAVVLASALQRQLRSRVKNRTSGQTLQERIVIARRRNRHWRHGQWA